MDATIYFTIARRKFVPQEAQAKIAWLEKHGAAPGESQVAVTASLASWVRAGASVDDDGIADIDSWKPAPCELIRRACVRLEQGEKNIELGEDDVIAAGDVWQKELAERAEEDRIKEAKKAADLAERIKEISDRGIDGLLKKSEGRWQTTDLSDVWQQRELILKALGSDAYLLAEKEAAARNVKIDEARKVYDAAIRDVASTFDDLCRAASENYAVENAVLGRLAKSLRDEVKAPHAEIDTCLYTGLEDRAAPSKGNFALRDSVWAAAEEANKRIPPTIGQWIVSRIVRLEKDDDSFVTVVLATLKTPFAESREVTFSLESLDD